LAAARKEAVDCAHDQHGHAGKGQGLQIGRFHLLEGRFMACQADQPWRRRRHQKKDRAGRDAKVNTLPDRRSDPARPARSHILRDKSGGVTGGDTQKPEKQPIPHHRRKRGGHFARIVPGQEQGVDKYLHRHEALTDDERRRQRQQLPAAAVSRCPAGLRGLNGAPDGGAGIQFRRIHNWHDCFPGVFRFSPHPDPLRRRGEGGGQQLRCARWKKGSGFACFRPKICQNTPDS
jgi:hypothetical protein